jgi:hypothetical protein
MLDGEVADDAEVSPEAGCIRHISPEKVVDGYCEWARFRVLDDLFFSLFVGK